MSTHSTRHPNPLRLFVVPLLLVVPAAAAATPDGATPPPLEEDDLPSVHPAPAHAEIVDTPHGRWRVHRQDPPRFEGLAEADLHDFRAVLQTGEPRLVPLVIGKVDIRNAMASQAPPGMRLAPFEEPLFVVPGVPEDPRYDDQIYDSPKRRFRVECIKRARDYVDAYRSLAKAPDLSRHFPDALRPVAAAYKLACFTDFHDIPEDIRKVVGTLLVNDAPFCSATIIGSNELLTARHCFFAMGTGRPNDAWRGIEHGRIEFRPWAPHDDTLEHFRVDYPPGATPSPSPFASHDDVLALALAETAKAWAPRHPLPATIPAPVEAWLVGTNALLDDLNNVRDLEQLVRATGPDDACALLETTSAGCIYHTCQAGPTASGAGLIVKTGDGIAVAGVHGGTMAAARDCQQDAPTHLTMNLAARYPSPS